MAAQKKITERIQEAMINPDLDQVQKEVRAALEEMKTQPEKTDLLTGIIERGKLGLRADLKELNIAKAGWPSYEQALERRFRVGITDVTKEAILHSLEAEKLDAFVNDYAHYAGLDTIIAECKRKESNDPLKRLIRTMQAATPLFAGIAAGFKQWLSQGRPAESSGKPSQLDAAAARADQVLGSDEGNKPGQKPSVSGSTTPALSGGGSGPSNGPAPSGESRRRGTRTGNGDASRVESGGMVDYHIEAADAEQKLAPDAFRRRYESIQDRHARNMFVLQQVAAGNASNAFEKLKITGSTGGVVEMDVDRSGLRVAGMEVQLDGPTAMAAAELTGCALPTTWISDQVYRRALETGGTVKFIAAPDIAASLGITDWDPDHPNGRKMMGAQFALRRDELLRQWRQQHGVRDDQLVAGYFKDIIHPTDKTRPGMIDIYGGKDGGEGKGNTIQSAGGNYHEATYSDYSHQLRRVGRRVKVTIHGVTREMDISEFYSNAECAKEFGFAPQPLGEAYAYSPALRRWVDAHRKGERPDALKEHPASSN